MRSLIRVVMLLGLCSISLFGYTQNTGVIHFRGRIVEGGCEAIVLLYTTIKIQCSRSSGTKTTTIKVSKTPSLLPDDIGEVSYRKLSEQLGVITINYY